RHADDGIASRAATLEYTHPRWIHPIKRVMATGKSELTWDAGNPPADADPGDAEHLAMSRELGLVSVMVVPIRVRGLSLGAMTLGTGEWRRGYRTSDVAAAEDLAARVGVAIERVLLHRETQEAVVASARHAAQLRRLMEAALAVSAPLAP